MIQCRYLGGGGEAGSAPIISIDVTAAEIIPRTHLTGCVSRRTLKSVPG